MKELIELADKDGFRWFGMANTASRAEREKQAEDLIRMMQDLVSKNGRDKYVKTQMTERITETVVELEKKEAADKGMSLKEATARIKRRIIEDKVPETFTKAVTGFVRDADKGIHFIMKTPGTKKTNICSVM
ncbi:uncharacterized protein LOC143291749 [Babylonia areolata]|uniref:uncharacterized protein LOC143291749 n=1 Tax=Babylonia areolata TaxID=304850 RepID=UPI003FD6B7D1